VALALVIILSIRMHSLTLMMTLRTVQAVPTLPGVISMTYPTMMTESAVDVMKEWVKHMDNITELVPIEVMILMSFDVVYVQSGQNFVQCTTCTHGQNTFAP